MMENNALSLEKLQSEMNEIGRIAKSAAGKLSVVSAEDKVKCLNYMADCILEDMKNILSANRLDMAYGREHNLSSAMLDRLMLDEKRVIAVAEALRVVAAQQDPVGRIISSAERPNGIKIDKRSVPIGVIGIIYESRPNVTVDAAGICLKAGNAVILRGGSEAFNSSQAFAASMARAAAKFGLQGVVQVLPWSDRRAVSLLLKLDKYVDLIIPRGGEGLIRAVMAESIIPVIKHYKGVCHLFVDKDADLTMACRIVLNGKCQRPGVCNALEQILIHRDIAEKFVPMMVRTMSEYQVKYCGDAEFIALYPEATAAQEADYEREFLDYKVAVKIVSGVEEAVSRINTNGSHHSDVIITQNDSTAQYFVNMVDSAAVYHNASSRFTDGGEFGMGAEIGISTDKLHARGPMGVDELTTYKYIIRGDGQVR